MGTDELSGERIKFMQTPEQFTSTTRNLGIRLEAVLLFPCRKHCSEQTAEKKNTYGTRSPEVRGI